MTRYPEDPGKFPGPWIAVRGPWEVQITVAPGDIGPGWMFPGRGFWRGFGDGCRRILLADRGPIGGPGGHWTARRGHRCRPADRAPGTFGGDQRARPGLV